MKKIRREILRIYLPWVVFGMLLLVILIIPGRGAAMSKQATDQLIAAAQIGDYSTILKLASRGVNVNDRDDKGRTALLQLCSVEGIYPEDLKNRAKIVHLLLRYGVNVNTPDPNKYTPLMEACMFGQSEVVKVLLKAGANPNSKDQYGYTPLMYTIKGSALGSVNRAGIIKDLIKSGADVNANVILLKNHLITHVTALSLAKSHETASFPGDKTITNLLIQAGAKE